MRELSKEYAIREQQIKRAIERAKEKILTYEVIIRSLESELEKLGQPTKLD
jgi:hypothetical protein